MWFCLYLRPQECTHSVLVVDISALTPLFSVPSHRFLSVARFFQNLCPFFIVYIFTLNTLILKHKCRGCLQVTSQCSWLLSLEGLRWSGILYLFPVLWIPRVIPKSRNLPLTLLWTQRFLIVALFPLGQLTIWLCVGRVVIVEPTPRWVYFHLNFNLDYLKSRLSSY